MFSQRKGFPFGLIYIKISTVVDSKGNKGMSPKTVCRKEKAKLSKILFQASLKKERLIYLRVWGAGTQVLSQATSLRNTQGFPMPGTAGSRQE